MSALTDYCEDALLEHVVGKTAFAMPTSYLALWNGDPTDAGSGGTELSGGGYARIATAGPDWNAASGGSITNASAFLWNEATGDWIEATHGALMDAPTGGNMLAKGALSTPKSIGTGDQFRIAADNLSLSFD